MSSPRHRSPPAPILQNQVLAFSSHLLIHFTSHFPLFLSLNQRQSHRKSMSSPLTLSSSPPSLSSLFSSLSPSPSPKPYFHHFSICCGPRDNRPQLLRGRILSSEAILAIQALKRSSSRSTDSSSSADLRPLFSRLIKPDLLAALRELLRQNHCLLALTVFSSARREPWYRTDYSLYAEIISALARNGMPSEIDRLVADIIEEGFYAGDSRGLGRLLRTLVAAERPKAVIDVYHLMKRGECVLDEFMYKVLTKGLKRLGEIEVADEIERDYASKV